MNDADRLLRTRFRPGADDVLFDGLVFDERMKERVRRELRAAPEPFVPVERTGRRRIPGRLLGLLSAAAAIAVALVALSQLSPSSPANPVPTESVPTLMGTGTVDGELRTQVLNDAEEARALWDGELPLPDYVPDSYRMDRMLAYRQGERPVHRIALVYSAADGTTYSASVDNQSFGELLPDGEQVEINGSTGYMIGDEQVGISLTWATEGQVLSVVGQLPKEEAINVARSFRPAT